LTSIYEQVKNGLDQLEPPRLAAELIFGNFIKGRHSEIVFNCAKIDIKQNLKEFDTARLERSKSGFRVMLTGFLSESATRVIDEVRKNQGLGPKLVGKQTITLFLLCRLPSYCSGFEPEERESMRVKRH
jgi:hypothetical protein